MSENENTISLAKFQEEQEKTNRRLESMQRTVDLLFADREIFENVLSRLTAIEEKLGLTSQHDETIRKDIKSEIQMSGDRLQAKVETKIDEIKSMVAKKKTMRPPSEKNWWERFVDRWT